MARILMVNVPYAGHTNPTLPLSEELVRRGHAVFYINAPEFREKIEETGASFVPYVNYPAHLSEQQKKTSCFQAAFDTALGLSQQFDLLIYEMFFYPGIRIAEQLGIPCVRQFSQPAWCAESVHAASKFFELSCKLIDVQIMGRKKAAYMGLKNKTLIDAVLKDKPDFNLVYVPRTFQAHADAFGENFSFTLPPFRPMPAKVAIPYEEMKAPILYISLGSLISNRGFCKKCLHAFGGKNFSVILNIGKIDPATLGKIPDNIRCYAFVPQIEVLAHADVFLTHCGMNSVNEALALGVPMVAMPFINDQISNAGRIVALGIGKRVRAFPSRGKDLYQTALDVLQDEGMKNRCLALQGALGAERAFDAAVNRIEALLPPEPAVPEGRRRAERHDNRASDGGG